MQLFQHICQNLIALLELCHSGHNLFISTILTSVLQLLCQIGQFGRMGSIVVNHIVHQRAQLCERCATVLVMMVVMSMLMVMVLVVMVVVVTMQVLMGMGMFMVVGMTVVMLVGVGMTIVGMLVGVAVGMLMAMRAIVVVFVTHSNQNSFFVVTWYSANRPVLNYSILSSAPQAPNGDIIVQKTEQNIHLWDLQPMHFPSIM